MLKRMSWVVPLILALFATAVDANPANPLRRKRGERQQQAPEFDPRAAGAAMALLIGGTLLLSERRRRDKRESE
jgi:hypothetical protein